MSKQDTPLPPLARLADLPAAPAAAAPDASHAAASPNPFYRHHLFFCANARKPGERTSCGHKGGEEGRAYAKKRLKKLGLTGEGRGRVNLAGCLDRCELGPVLVVYPQGVWYTFDGERDLDAIIDEHLVGGRVVERLLLPPAAPAPAVSVEELKARKDKDKGRKNKD